MRAFPMISSSRPAGLGLAGRCLIVACVVAASLGCTDRPRPSGEKTKQMAASGPRKEFEQVFERWLAMLAEVGRLELAFHSSITRERETIAKQHFDKVMEGYAMENELLVAAMRALIDDPEKNEDLKEFLVEVYLLLATAECYEDALRILEMLLENEIEDDRVYQTAIDVAFACSEFALAKNILEISQKRVGNLAEIKDRLASLEFLSEQWEREQKMRDAEQLANDLPRVVLITRYGEIELELFENQAPNTVANFITLVEQGFYDGRAFHEVTARSTAQAGCPVGDGSGSPGYFQRHEFDHPDARLPFRGTLNTVGEGPMANGCQFQLTFTLAPQLVGQSTTFGRIVRGIEVLARLQRRGADAMSSQGDPDLILAARVVRKRNHPYKADIIHDPTAKDREERSKIIRKLMTR